MDLDEEHTVIIWREPGESKYRAMCETCMKLLGRFDTYPEAYGAGVRHERREDDDGEREG